LLEENVPRLLQQRPTTENADSCFGANLAIFVSLSLSQSSFICRYFYRVRHFENLKIVVVISTLSVHSSRDINIFGFGGHAAISGHQSLSQSFVDSLIRAKHGRKRQICRWKNAVPCYSL